MPVKENKFTQILQTITSEVLLSRCANPSNYDRMTRFDDIAELEHAQNVFIIATQLHVVM